MAQSYSNSGGSGNRQYLVLVKNTGITWGGVSNGNRFLVVGSPNSTIWFPSGGTVSSMSITFDFGCPKIVDEAKWYQDNGTAQGTWKWQGSNDDSSYTDIGSSFTLGGATPFQTQTQLNGNTTPYRYYRLLGISGSTSSSPFQQGVLFQIDAVSSSVNDYGNTEGAGDRTATMTVTQSQSAGHGDLIFGRAGVQDPIMSLFVDNLNRVDSSGTGALEFKTGFEAVSGKWIRFQFSGYRIIDEIRWFQDTTDTNGTWKVQGSNDGTTFVDIGSTFTLGGAWDGAYGYSRITTPNGNTTAYLYYRLLGVSGNGSLNPFIFEAAFRTKDGAAPATGSLFRASNLSGIGSGGALFSDPLG